MCKASRVKATACSGCHCCPKMAQDCPLCFTKGVFQQWNLLKDSLVSLSTRSFICPLCCGVHEGLDKFTLHLVSHEMEAKKSSRNEDVPTISIKEGSAVDSLDELLADFSEFVKQEDKLSYDNQVKLRTKAPNPLRMSPKNKSPIGLPMSVISSGNAMNNHFPTIQTPLPLPQTFKANQNLLMSHHHAQDEPTSIDKSVHVPQTATMMSNQSPPLVTRPAAAAPQVQTNANQNKPPSSMTGDQPSSPPNQVQCSLCGWNFDNDEFLKVHTVLMHSKRNQAFLQRRLKRVVDEYKCRECDSTFAAYEDFVSHLKQAHNDHRFVCHICAKIFKLRGSLLVHLRVVHNPLGIIIVLFSRRPSNKWRQNKISVHLLRRLEIQFQPMKRIIAKFAIVNSPTSIEKMSTRRSIPMQGNLSVPNVAWHLKRKASLKSTWKRIKRNTNATFVEGRFTLRLPFLFMLWVIRIATRRWTMRLQCLLLSSKCMQ